MTKIVRICAVVAAACAPPVWAQDLALQQAALKVIQETSASICTTIPIEGSENSLQLTGDAKAKLAGAIGKVVDLGIGGAAKYQAGQYKGVIQKELATAIKSNNECRLTVFNTLVEKMLSAPIPPKHVGEPQPVILYTYAVATKDGNVCSNGRIEKRAGGGWVELIPADAACHQQPMGYMELGEDDGWFYIFDAARNMTARIPRVSGNVNWLQEKVYPAQGASKQWNMSQAIVRVN